MKNSYITPSWPAPSNVKAYCTTRLNGFSEAPYESFNLGDHVGDEVTAIQKNRKKLYADLVLPAECTWLQQEHGIEVLNLDTPHNNNIADGSYTSKPKIISTIMTADCLPLLFCNKSGTEVMALHGGWRSLASGIIENGIKHFAAKSEDILVWLGPAIGHNYFEVGDEVREQFIERFQNANTCFTPSPNNRWLLDIYQIATLQLNQLGITAIYGAEHCTYEDKQRFFSYRRDGETGRMVSLIYFQ